MRLVWNHEHSGVESLGFLGIRGIAVINPNMKKE